MENNPQGEIYSSTRSEIVVSDKETAAKLSPPPAPKKQHLRIKLLFEDEHILVVNKQAGLLSAVTDKMEPTLSIPGLLTILNQKTKNPGHSLFTGWIEKPLV